MTPQPGHSDPHDSGQPADLPPQDLAWQDLTVEGLAPGQVWAEQVAGDPVWHSADTIERQTRILDDELSALLTEQTSDQANDHVTAPGTATPADTSDTSVIPGFEALTWADLAEARRIGDLLAAEPVLDEPTSGCPPWCQDADTDTDARAASYEGADGGEHVGTRHAIQVDRGGTTFGNPGAPATLSVQLEQPHDRHNPPAVVLGVEIDGNEHEAHLSTAEAGTLRHTLGTLLNQAVSEATGVTEIPDDSASEG